MKRAGELKAKSKQQKISVFNSKQNGEEIVWELDADDDDDAFDHPDIRHNSFYQRPLEQYYNDLIRAYREKRYKFVYKHLKRSPLVAFISDKLALYFNEELSSYFKEFSSDKTYKKCVKTNKRYVSEKTIKALGSEKNKLVSQETYQKTKVSKDIIKVLRSIYYLNSNKRSLPSVYGNILVGYLQDAAVTTAVAPPNAAANHPNIDSYLPRLYSPNFQTKNSCFYFLILKIAADILSNIFAKFPTKESDDTCQNVLVKICCDSFVDISAQLPFVHFYAIAVYLSVGIEMLPETFYPSLDAYFKHLFGGPSQEKNNTPGIVSQNVVSSHCVLKIWDEITFLYECYVKYCFIYPHIMENKVNFKTLVPPDHKKLEYFSFIRFKMRHEYIHFENSYVPCEYPLISNSSSYLKSLPSSNESYHLFSFKEMYFDSENILDEIVVAGYCENCKKSKCSCVKKRTKVERRTKRKPDPSIGVYAHFYSLRKYKISYFVSSTSTVKKYAFTSRKRKKCGMVF